jgi:predicted RNA binding protein YcfA (HicA-like mRNA interferase family)
MSRAPRITGKQLIRALEKAGFALVRQRSNHCRMRHVDGRVTTVSVHAGETIGQGLLNKVLRDCEMTTEQLLQLL